MASQVTKGEILDYASRRSHLDLDPTDDYDDLRDQVNIKTCNYCDDEYLTGWSAAFCTDGCEVQYIHENDHL